MVKNEKLRKVILESTFFTLSQYNTQLLSHSTIAKETKTSKGSGQFLFADGIVLGPQILKDATDNLRLSRTLSTK